MEKLIQLLKSTDDAVRSHLARAADYAAQYTSAKRRALEFDEGDLVMLATTNLPLPAPLSRKLAAKWIGPLRVLARVGAMAYRV